MDRFDAMQAFARVVETGSFSKAAETLHMSRTTVTQLVQQLEVRLRVKLLNRTTRKVNVTSDEARGELVPLFEDWQLEPMPIHVAFPPNRYISRKLRVFIDWIAELMAQLGSYKESDSSA